MSMQLETGADARVSGKLETFLTGAGTLTTAERLTIVNQAIALIDGFYAHLPLKRAMHAVDPMQRLRLLRRRLGQIKDEARFHAEMTSIFTSVRDLHTNYLLPAPFSRVEAWLPFLVEVCVDAGARRYIVTRTADGIPDATFVPGVEITHWNGVPIERAVDNAADRHAGSNAAARFSNGLAGLTIRPLFLVPPPDEEWVTVSYRDDAGAEFETTFEWQASGVPATDEGEVATSGGQAARRGFDLQTVTVQRARQRLFAPQVHQAAQAIVAAGGELPAGAGPTATTIPGNFLARIVTTATGDVGYIRIWSFSDDNGQFADAGQFIDGFVAEFARLVDLMPAEGLIIDVRDNGGGYIGAGERILQLLTPYWVEPERFQFINTPLTQALVARAPDLADWRPSMDRAVETGATFSGGFPLTDPASCNDLGQRYHGPVVLITSARCYSTTDMFAAGFQDHDIGPVLGVDENTGAGGANVWDFRDLRRAVAPGTLEPLPADVGMRVAIRRSLRVGRNAGTELEDLGVTPDAVHGMTLRDLMEGNADLIEKAASLLDPERRFRLEATLERADSTLKLAVTTQNIDRLDVDLDGRPRESLDVPDGVSTIELTAGENGSIAIRGYKGGRLVASRRVDFGP